MELLVALLVLGYVVFKLSGLASQPGQRVEPKPKEEKVVVPKPVPVPTQAEQAAALKVKYEATVRMLDAAAMDAVEREAGKEKAKQDYLKALNGLM